MSRTFIRYSPYYKIICREICDVFLKTKVANQVVGNKTIPAAGTPVCHFDSLKTSTVEGAATVVYATGGKGNPRLIAWEGERTLTFTMEDALISPMGITLLTGAGLITAGGSEDYDPESIPRHVTEKITVKAEGKVTTDQVIHQPATSKDDFPIFVCKLNAEGDPTGEFTAGTGTNEANEVSITNAKVGEAYLVDYYTLETSGFSQIDIEPNKFGGNYYLEAATLFRATDGKDYPAEFIIPNCKIQSNFTFSMASSGDPSTFTYTVDAFPGVTKYNKTKKVLCAIQMFNDEDTTKNVPAASATRTMSRSEI